MGDNKLVYSQNLLNMNMQLLEEWRLHGIISQKTPFFMVTAVKTPRLTYAATCKQYGN
jgi:hypothetical protein